VESTAGRGFARGSGAIRRRILAAVHSRHLAPQGLTWRVGELPSEPPR